MKIKTFNPLDYPVFYADPLRQAYVSVWVEHIPFAMLLVDILRPRIFVELGTQTGVSYSAFCQAVKQLEINTHCYAVDNWHGDKHAGYYGSEILEEFRKHHDPLYGSFSDLMQKEFDDAVNSFSDG